MHYDLAILGAGAAGMMAAVAAAEGCIEPATGKARLRMGLFEKNAQAGVKVLVCGGGRCNFTNAGSVGFLIEQFGRNGRFLTPALEHLDNKGLREFFAQRGVPSHEEPGGKIYPDSNQARSVVNALVGRIRELGVEVLTGAAGTITSVEHLAGGGFQLRTKQSEIHTAGALILAVGGKSYERMGTTGDGYRMAQDLGHTVVTPRPAIVGLLVQEEWPKALKGLAVPDVEVRIMVPGILPKLATGKPTPSTGAMLFTHFGLSGPAILNPSEIVAELLEKFPTVCLKIDFARGHSHDELAARMRLWQQHHGKQRLKGLLTPHSKDITITSTSPDQTAPEGNVKAGDGDFRIPHRLAEKFCELEAISPDQPCSVLTSGQIHRLIERIKNSRFTVRATRGFAEAMVTAGGVTLAEVNPKTMESKIVPNLFLTGEILDLTGPSGGYNLQLAFSTGHLAGRVVSERF